MFKLSEFFLFARTDSFGRSCCSFVDGFLLFI